MNLNPAVPISRWQLGNPRFNPVPQLSSGSVVAPIVSTAAMGALQAAVDDLVDGLTREIQAVQTEMDLVSPAAVRVDPASAQQISFIGSLAPQEIRSALNLSARGLGELVNRILTGALSSYLTSAQSQALSSLKIQAGQEVAALQNEDTLPIAAQDQGAVASYLSMHLDALTAQVQAVEKGVVTAEAGSVPVIEPMEQHAAILTIALGVGVAAGLGILLYTLL